MPQIRCYFIRQNSRPRRNYYNLKHKIISYTHNIHVYEVFISCTKCVYFQKLNPSPSGKQMFFPYVYKRVSATAFKSELFSIVGRNTSLLFPTLLFHSEFLRPLEKELMYLDSKLPAHPAQLTVTSACSQTLNNHGHRLNINASEKLLWEQQLTSNEITPVNRSS